MTIDINECWDRGHKRPESTVIERPYLPGPVCGASDVAALVKLTPRQVQKLAETGAIPGASKLGKLWAFNSAQVFEWAGITVDSDELHDVIFDGLSWPVCTPDEVAELLHTSVQNVQKLARDGELPGAFLVGTRWRFNTRELLAHVGYDV